ncbi:MAG: hypothetical protein Kow0022_15070 [Phycisphaerales bacterium]
MRSLLANTHATVLIAHHRSRPVGCGIGLIRRHTSGVSARIYSVAVLPDARGMGVGRCLAEALLLEFARAGARRTYLEVRVENSPAIALYESLGFRRVSALPDYYARGQHGLRFCRSLETGDLVLSSPPEHHELQDSCRFD